MKIEQISIDGFVKSSNCCVTLHLLSLRRTDKYAAFLKIRKPCIWSFLLCRPNFDFLRVP
jgi:hypothetical protein